MAEAGEGIQKLSETVVSQINELPVEGDSEKEVKPLNQGQLKDHFGKLERAFNKIGINRKSNPKKKGKDIRSWAQLKGVPGKISVEFSEPEQPSGQVIIEVIIEHDQKDEKDKTVGEILTLGSEGTAASYLRYHDESLNNRVIVSSLSEKSRLLSGNIIRITKMIEQATSQPRPGFRSRLLSLLKG